MNLLDALTDDQIALLGCFGALAVSFGIMSLTWTVRQAVTPQKEASPTIRAARVPPQQEAEIRKAA
jgi:hypothetical protein